MRSTIYVGLALLVATGAATLPTAPRARATKAARAKKPSPRRDDVGARVAVGRRAAVASGGAVARPSYLWALLHNWMYFLSLGLTVPNLPRIIASVVNEDGTSKVTPRAVRVSGDVEALDKTLTFLGVGFLSALSDVVGRKPLMAWSALGYGLTCLLQATCPASSVARLFVADAVDGASSCMSSVCQAFVADASDDARRAINLGTFQGLSIGGAFVVAFPLGGLLGAKLGTRAPVLLAAGVQLLNFLLIAFVTPESKPARERAGARLDLRHANPVGALARLFCDGAVLRGLSVAYFLVTLSRGVLDAQFANYALYRFGWGPQESGPLLMLVGVMLAIAPRVVVPRLGLRRAIVAGALALALGHALTAVAGTPAAFVGSIFVTAVGCACIPAIVAVLTTQTAPNEQGALLGGLGSIQELCGALGNPAYARLFAYFISDAAPVKLPGAHFVFASALMIACFAVSRRTFRAHEGEIVLPKFD